MHSHLLSKERDLFSIYPERTVLPKQLASITAPTLYFADIPTHL